MSKIESVKAPYDAVSRGKSVPKYGTTYGQRDLLGRFFFCYSNPDDADNYLEQTQYPDGSYTTREYDSEEKGNTTELDVGNKFSYTGDGISNHCDGHRDTNSMSTERRNSMGQLGESALALMAAYPQGRVVAVTESDTKIVSAKSTSFSGLGSYGDYVQEHKGHHHSAYEKDCVAAVKGNKLTMVTNDYGVHVQDGSYDCHIGANGRIYSTKDLLIESATKITLKVGSSTITITPSNIEILAAGGSGRIDLNK